MKQRFLLIFSFFILSICILPSAQATETAPAPAAAPASDLEMIDNEIKELQASLDKLREKALNKEVQSQPLLFDNWEEFAKGIQDNEEDEKKILSIKKQIEGLQQKKQALLQHKSKK